MTREQLEAVYDELVSNVGSTNRAVADEDRGPGCQMLVLSIADDGSGSIGQRHPSDAAVQDWYAFDNFEDLVQVLKNVGVEFEPGGQL